MLISAIPEFSWLCYETIIQFLELFNGSYSITESFDETCYSCITSTSRISLLLQAQVGYHCYYKRPRAKPEVEC